MGHILEKLVGVARELSSREMALVFVFLCDEHQAMLFLQCADLCCLPDVTLGRGGDVTQRALTKEGDFHSGGFNQWGDGD